MGQTRQERQDKIFDACAAAHTRHETAVTETRKLLDRVAAIGKLAYIEGARPGISKAQAIGIQLSSYFDWDGLALLELAAEALEDSNFHAECESVRRMIAKIKGI